MRNVALLAVLAAFPAHAAGYYVGELGSRAMSRGGADIVSPDDPMAAWLNPAALTFAKGIQFDVDLNLVYLESSFTRNCGGIVNGCGPKKVSRSYVGTDGKSQQVYTVSPTRAPPTNDDKPGPPDVNSLGNFGTPSHFDGTTPTVNTGGVQPVPRIMLSVNGDTFGVDGVALGAYVYAPNNGKYTFGEDTPTRYNLIDRDLLEVYYGLAFGYRFGDVIAVGAGLQFVTAGLNQSIRLSADLYGNEDPNSDVQVRIHGEQDFIPSGNFGVWSNPGKLMGIGDLEVGGSVQLGRTVKASGPLVLEKLGSNVQALVDSKTVTFDVAHAIGTTEFRLAPFYRIGAKYGQKEGPVAWNVEGDFVYEQWSVYDHVFLQTNGAKVAFNGAPAKELDPVVQPKDWTDAWSARLGGSAAFLDGMVGVSGGGFYESSAIPNSTYDIELADGNKIGAGLGVFGKMWGCRLDVGYSHVFIFDRTVGDESIVYDGVAGASLIGESRTRVAMGKYSAGFEMVDVQLTVGIDELFGFGEAHKPASQAK